MDSGDKNIVVLNAIESTNNYASQLVSDKPEECTVVLAQFQHKGRGQQGNYWESEPGKNLLMSMILYPGFLPADKQFYISKIVSLALAEVLDAEVGQVAIKWPNDMYIGTKKVAGILIENAIKGFHLDHSIVGIGLNLNQETFLSDAPNPVSLRQLTQKDYGNLDIAKRFREVFRNWYQALKEGKLSEVDAAYFGRLLGKNEWRKYRSGDNEFEARIVGTGEYGKLQLEDRKGQILEFMFKEVEFVF
ncbi:biotin--[acetyl-CoA-carboxylase] ligase [Maribellus sediminis]|uniref:biotin--[acetyl-CoA-carboxylase] ligase n=1 Tax=Maribellus sediminis TaxID=2696285 RepID=UPI00143053F3|nr:biotin--[acetyl-CoA-carboxylase] ligase [Maribellus sediminis]